jgi:hypothetical protein
MIFFLVIGVPALAIGLLSIFSESFNEYLRSKFPDSEADVMLFSARNRYLISRYVAGIGEIFIGMASIAIYIESNPHLSSALSAFLSTVQDIVRSQI